MIANCKILPENFFPVTFSVRSDDGDARVDPLSDIPALDNNAVSDTSACMDVPEVGIVCISFSWVVGRFLLFLVNRMKREYVV